MSEKFERKRERNAENQRDKVAEIINSNMPEHQKNEYLKQIGHIVEEKKEGVSFSVYARIKRINSSLHKAMLAYPKVKGVSVASLSEWDQLFKDF